VIRVHLVADFGDVSAVSRCFPPFSILDGNCFLSSSTWSVAHTQAGALRVELHFWRFLQAIVAGSPAWRAWIGGTFPQPAFRVRRSRTGRHSIETLGNQACHRSSSNYIAGRDPVRMSARDGDTGPRVSDDWFGQGSRSDGRGEFGDVSLHRKRVSLSQPEGPRVHRCSLLFAPDRNESQESNWGYHEHSRGCRIGGNHGVWTAT
jgi:hypothetical protein